MRSGQRVYHSCDEDDGAGGEGGCAAGGEGPRYHFLRGAHDVKETGRDGRSEHDIFSVFRDSFVSCPAANGSPTDDEDGTTQRTGTHEGTCEQLRMRHYQCVLF